MDLVTGASGFIGSHVARALAERGEPPRCLLRPGTDARNLEDVPHEAVAGDLRDAASLVHAMRGVRTVYHCAADYRLFAREPAALYEANVQGTRNVLGAAAKAGVARVVHTSSVGTLGHRDGQPADEWTPVAESDMTGHYKRSKFLAEREAERWAKQGLDVVIVNPATPVGEGDRKPTPTGRLIVDFARRRMPAYIDTGLNFVDVRDVAAGHLLAAERGRAGEKYILGHRNLALRELFALLAPLAGVPAPRWRLPHAAALALAYADTGACHLLGGTPRVPVEGVRMARRAMYFDAGRAVRELGLPQSPIEEALARALAWFRREGYLS